MILEKNYQKFFKKFCFPGSDHSWLKWRVLWRRHERGWGWQTQRGQSRGQQQLCVCGSRDKDREVYHQIKTEQEEGQYQSGKQVDVQSLQRLFGVQESQLPIISQFFWFTNCHLTPSYPEDVANEIHSNVKLFLLLFQDFNFIWSISCCVIHNMGSLEHQIIDPVPLTLTPLTLVCCVSILDPVHNDENSRPS